MKAQTKVFETSWSCTSLSFAFITSKNSGFPRTRRMAPVNSLLVRCCVPLRQKTAREVLVRTVDGDQLLEPPDDGMSCLQEAMQQFKTAKPRPPSNNETCIRICICIVLYCIVLYSSLNFCNLGIPNQIRAVLSAMSFGVLRHAS